MEVKQFVFYENIMNRNINSIMLKFQFSNGEALQNLEHAPVSLHFHLYEVKLKQGEIYTFSIYPPFHLLDRTATLLDHSLMLIC